MLAFKGVLLEGLEIAFIVVSFGAQADRFLAAGAAGAAALLLIGGTGAAFHGLLSRIPGQVLQLVVGLLLSSFGTFWAVEGLHLEWPLGDFAIAGLLVVYALVAGAYLWMTRERKLGLAPATES